MTCKRKQAGYTGPYTNLNFWSVFNDSDYFAPIIADFEAQNPGLKINFKKLTIEEYEKSLLEAFAEGKGPDIFSISSAWLPRYLNRLYPAPKEMISLENFNEVFVDAGQDLIYQERIYALPLSLDTLALYYNVDLFNSKGILNPPTSWDEFLKDVEKLTVLDEKGEIALAGAGIGAGKNINRGTDILTVLMMQSGEKMSVDKTAPSFGQAGLDALKFYTDFTNPKKKAYTWNLLRDYSIDDFTQSNSAMMVNYHYHLPTIQKKSPNLRFKIAPLPQIDEAHKINYTIFWGEGVSINSKYKEEAWKFLIYLNSKDSARKYLTASNRISPRRDLIEEQAKNPELREFANQALTAKTWYQAGNPEVIENILTETIDSVVLGQKTAEQALKFAQEEIGNVFLQAKKP